MNALLFDGAGLHLGGKMKPDPETEPEPMRQTAQSAPRRMLRHLPLIAIVLVAVVGAVTLRDPLY